MKHKKDVGLRVGLEIHQRLATRSKLFCSCRADMNEDSFICDVKRKLRAVPGELGDIDPAALHEYMQNRMFVYKNYRGSTCLVEDDCEPPHGLNQDALHIGLQVCKLLDCDIPDEIHVMRKTVIDGSNTGGFQRTVVIGTNGRLETSFGGVDVYSVCLEEEAARIDDHSDGKITYRLSGLGIPLIEITTSNNISTPEQAHEVAEKIGLLLRSTKVQRGIGTIRQDVNISIRGGERIEIKGFQELREMKKLIENEVNRQKALLYIKDELLKRGSRIKDDVSD
ncbi:MAG: Glu-tRNA(Gln) amidotransferase subunit GatE, partial [Candidatus Aenigmatarchaeota archaeon]